MLDVFLDTQATLTELSQLFSAAFGQPVTMIPIDEMLDLALDLEGCWGTVGSVSGVVRRHVALCRLPELSAYALDEFYRHIARSLDSRLMIGDDSVNPYRYLELWDDSWETVLLDPHALDERNEFTII